LLASVLAWVLTGGGRVGGCPPTTGTESKGAHGAEPPATRWRTASFSGPRASSNDYVQALPPYPQEPPLIPKLRSHFADFPYSHCAQG